jgi:hypothetical protein
MIPRAFYLQVPIAVIAFISVFFAVRVKSPIITENLKIKMKRIDFLGSGVLILAVFCLLLGFERGADTTFISIEVISLLVGSAILFFVFVFVEAKISIEPLAPIRIMVNKSLLASYLSNFFAFVGIMAAIFNMSLYYQVVEKFNAKQAGLGLLPAVFGGVTGSLLGGLIMQKTGKYYWLTVISYTITLIGTVILCATTGVVVRSLIGNYIGELSII